MKSRGKPVENEVEYQVCEKIKRQDGYASSLDGYLLSHAYGLPPCRIYLTGDSRMEIELKAFMC